MAPLAPFKLVPLLAAHDNLLLLRTLSKGYSLAGLRFGYGLGPAAQNDRLLELLGDLLSGG